MMPRLLLLVFATVAYGCRTALDCSGGNGVCAGATSNSAGNCRCKPAWQGTACGELRAANSSARIAYQSDLWTWGGSPIVDPQTSIYHLFSSILSNHCGIDHYCVSSVVAHLTSRHPTGPFVQQDIAMAPRPGMWDNGAISDITVHRLPNRSYALFYMGAMRPGKTAQPNCTAGSGDTKANATLGSRNGRRIGIAIAESLDGPWSRLNSPVFGPDSSAWDNTDVSNPSPIIHQNGSVVLLYKGRGSSMQHMGLAFADSIDGPYRRNASGAVAADLPGEDPWGWIDSGGVYHALFHDGNGGSSAGSHRWSLDGIHWELSASAGTAYTGVVDWAADASPDRAGKQTVQARRERPQVLLSGEPGSSYGEPAYLFTSAEDCVPGEGQSDAGLGRPCSNGVGTDKSYTCVVTIMSIV